MELITTHEQYVYLKSYLEQLLSDPNHNPNDAQMTAQMTAQRLEEYEREVLGIKPEFRVDDEETLEWYVGKLADLESKKKRIQAQADAMIADCQREIDGLQWRFGDQADKVLRSLLSGRRKSVKFLTGTIGLRSTPAKVKDGGLDLTALSFFHPDIYKAVVSEKVDYNALNRMVKVVDGQPVDAESGEVLEVAGLQIVPAVEKMYVKAGAEND